MNRHFYISLREKATTETDAVLLRRAGTDNSTVVLLKHCYNISFSIFFFLSKKQNKPLCKIEISYVARPFTYINITLKS